MTAKTSHLKPICLLAAAVLQVSVARLAAAATDAALLCLQATEAAAQETGVPANILLAISLVETGQSRNGQLRPWPWAVNQGGDGRFLASKAEAAEVAQRALASGATNVDMGCFQINYRWHAENFGSLDDMLDPWSNARYAASFLADLYRDTGNWPDAAAAYHSRSPEHAARYLAKFEETLASLESAANMSPAPARDTQPDLEAQPRANHFPLLVQGNRSGRGSLVPALQATRRLIGAP